MFAVQTVCIVDMSVGSGTLRIAHGWPLQRVEICSVSNQYTFYAEVGRRVRLARERIGLTQDSLATQVMLSRTSVTNIEKGRQKVLAHTLCSLAEALSIPPAELLPETSLHPEGGANPASDEDDLSHPATAVVERKKRGKRPAHSR